MRQRRRTSPEARAGALDTAVMHVLGRHPRANALRVIRIPVSCLPQNHEVALSVKGMGCL
jgi:hypothetical protein